MSNVLDVLTTIRVYKIKRSKNEAELYCDNADSHLMEYDSDFLNAAVACSVGSVLTHAPWFLPIGEYLEFGVFQLTCTL